MKRTASGRNSSLVKGTKGTFDYPLGAGKALKSKTFDAEKQERALGSHFRYNEKFAFSIVHSINRSGQPGSSERNNNLEVWYRDQMGCDKQGQISDAWKTSVLDGQSNSNRPIGCMYCGSKQYRGMQCTKELSVGNRRKILKNNKLCYN